MSPKSGKNHSKFQNSLIFSKYEVTFSKVNQVIYSSAKISIPNIEAIAQTLFEISCTHDFKILFSNGHNSEKGNNLDMKKKYGSTIFFMRNLFMKFQNPSIHRLKVSISEPLQKMRVRLWPCNF